MHSSVRQRRKEDDGDMHLAQTIMHSKQYSMSSRADDEYDFDDAPSRKTRKKEGVNDRKLQTDKSNFAKRILTQQERCQFCFENPTRPRHLVVAIANFTYLMLPQWQPVTPGHCCILPMQVSLQSSFSISVFLYTMMQNNLCLLMNWILCYIQIFNSSCLQS